MGVGPAHLDALVVEDDSANRKLLAAVLEDDGWTVRVAGSAEEAMTILETYRPQVILLDLALPVMSGVHFARLLKADSQRQDIVLIAVTAYDSPGEALGAGCAACVRKPIDVASLPELVRAHVGHAA